MSVTPLQTTLETITKDTKIDFGMHWEERPHHEREVILRFKGSPKDIKELLDFIDYSIKFNIRVALGLEKV